ncbi:MAG: hypothetical protein QM714_13340 [Nocardioides sp.]|uniref:hypothetical protein n=1 Tax=Nocardioides sp. TaxID=35761 RepID=UPI0039E3BD13
MRIGRGERVHADGLDPQQRKVAEAIVGNAQLLVVEGAADEPTIAPAQHALRWVADNLPALWG